MTEYKPRDQMPKSVILLIAAVGELIAIKKKFEACKINVEQLADQLWNKVHDLVPAHEDAHAATHEAAE